MPHGSFMHRHLHGYNTSAVFLHSVFHANSGSSVAELTVKRDFAAPLTAFAACHPIAAQVYNKKPATKFEDPLIVIQPFAQAQDVMFDVPCSTKLLRIGEFLVVSGNKFLRFEMTEIFAGN